MLFQGSHGSYFEISKGVRKGDPISRYLFILTVEVFSIGITRVFQKGKASFYCTLRNFDPITHLLYTDDTLVFVNRKISSIRGILDFHEDYYKAPAQRLNV